MSATPPAPQAATPAVRWLTVDEESAGQRLDNFLMRHLKGVPKTHLYRLIRSGQVRLNKSHTSADARVQTGDQLRLPPVRVAAAPAPDAAPAPARSFEVLLEDEHLIAIDKPAGVAVHGGSGLSFGVIEQLRSARPQARFLELVHRLEPGTRCYLVDPRPPAVAGVQIVIVFSSQVQLLLVIYYLKSLIVFLRKIL